MFFNKTYKDAWHSNTIFALFNISEDFASAFHELPELKNIHEKNVTVQHIKRIDKNRYEFDEIHNNITTGGIFYSVKYSVEVEVEKRGTATKIVSRKIVKKEFNECSELLKKVIKLYLKKSFDDAILLIEDGLKCKNRFTRANFLFFKGKITKDLKRYSEAIPFFQQAIKLNGKFTDAYNNLAETYLLLFKFDEALTNLRKSYKINPDQDDVANLIIFLNIIAKYDLSEIIRHRHIALFTDSYSEIVEKIVSLSVKTNPGLRLLLGFFYYKLMQYDNSLKVLLDLNYTYPDEEYVLFLLGQIYFLKGKFEQSYTVFQQITNNKLLLKFKYLYLARIMQKTRKFREAITFYTKFLDYTSNKGDIYFLISILYQKLRLKEKEKEFLFTAIKHKISTNFMKRVLKRLQQVDIH